jgi:hypothetical protein
MLTWEYCELFFTDNSQNKWRLRYYTPEGTREEKNRLNPDPEGLRVQIALLGLDGWEMLSATNSNYYFKRIIKKKRSSDILRGNFFR